MLNPNDKAKLGDLDKAIRATRISRAEALKLVTAADAAAKAHPTAETQETAKLAKARLAQVDTGLGELEVRQSEALGDLANLEGGRADLGLSSADDGWSKAAASLDLDHGQLRVNVQASDLLRPAAAVSPPKPPPGGPSPAIPPAVRYLYPALASAPFGNQTSDLAATDFVIAASTFENAVTGGVEIGTATTTTKATMPLTVTIATPTARTFAIVAEAVPAKLFETQAALNAFLSTEMSRRLGDAYDSHVVSAIESATPPNGSTGTDLVAKIRNAIAEARDLGSEPTVIALTPSDAASLDLSTDDGGYVFNVKAANGGDGVWQLAVREAPAVTHPLLIDPARIGLSYLATGTVLADPYSAMKTNQVRLRAEVEAKFHVRNIAQGAYSIH